MIDSLFQSVSRLDSLDYLLVFGSLLLLIFADWIVEGLCSKEVVGRTIYFRTNAIRGFAVLVIALLGYYRFYSVEQANNFIAIKLLSILVVLYLSYLSAYFVGEFIHRRFGRVYTLAETERIADTYTSRALSIFTSIFIGIVALISVIRIAGFSTLLEAGGVIGFIGVFLALTQGAWAPDIISGLIILNSKMFEERDVIKLSDSQHTILGTVFRTRAFHTELLNMVDNHRVMIRNSRMRDYTVHNLSRFANARGLRETLKFKIGYDIPVRLVKEMFQNAFEAAVQDSEILLEAQYPLEIRVQDTGDHAIEWSVHYYTKDSSQLVKTSQLFREVILNSSIEAGISLSTPITHSPT